ncbi:hypothetical protein BSK49_18975 [Paenibacillus odorifer]|uniref:hypothetical protein n=1 Tax=Paenibacillus odorifer TaxID=189426 RepID=UPI00096F1B8D|nr:hypothetical protein [Paenibacillus odorifer]OMD85600.1 hypothetical protein BSK49_18975 [Paenibacillus odorifer]
MEKPFQIIDEYHDHPRPGLMVPVWGREHGGHFIQVPPIQQNDEEQSFEHRWSKEEICSYLGVPEEMIKTIKANEREYEAMYREFIKTNFPFLLSVDLALGTDETVIRKVDSHEQSTV